MIYAMIVTFYFTAHPGIASETVSFHATLEECMAAAEEATERNMIGPSTQGFCFKTSDMEGE